MRRASLVVVAVGLAVGAPASLAGDDHLDAAHASISSSVTASSAGTLDPTFGCAAPPCPGFATNDLGIYSSVALQPDGKILAAGANSGALFVDRWHADGTLDLTFGCASPPCTGRANVVGFGVLIAVVVQPDGKIVAAGGQTGSFVVYRFASNGTLDPTFGCAAPPCSGFVNTPSPGLGRDVLLQPDGKIVVVGFQGLTGPMVIARYEPDGVPDQSFGCGAPPCAGFATGPTGVAYAVARQSDGKLVVAGVADVPDRMFRVARFGADGVLDPGFGCSSPPCSGFLDGPAGPSLTSSDPAFTDVAIQPDGKIVLAGNDGSNPVTPNFRVVRYDSSGALDPTFGCSAPPCPGFTTGPAGLVEGLGLALQPDGRIVVAGGSSQAGASASMRVLRLTANGVLDPTFGCSNPPCPGFGDGVSSGVGLSAVLQPDAKIVVVGLRLGQFGQDLPIVARFDNTDPIAAPALTVVPRFAG